MKRYPLLVAVWALSTVAGIGSGSAPRTGDLPGSAPPHRIHLSGSVTDLGDLKDRTAWAYAISGAGEVVGAVSDRARLRAFLFIRGRLEELGTLGGISSVARDMGPTGAVVGSASTGSGAVHAFLLADGRMRDLGTLGGSQSEALGINRSGWVVGASAVRGDGAEHAFLYRNGKLNDLGTLGGVDSRAEKINDRGQIVGWARTTRGEAHAFLHDRGRLQDLGTLGGPESVALGINRTGQVVGAARTADGVERAFLFHGGLMRSLPGTGPALRAPALGGAESRANAINDAGQIVGVAQRPDGKRRAFLFASGRMLDLNAVVPAGSGWTLTEAADINDAGQIVGTGFRRGQRRAFLLTLRPGPRPGTATGSR